MYKEGRIVGYSDGSGLIWVDSRCCSCFLPTSLLNMYSALHILAYLNSLRQVIARRRPRRLLLINAETPLRAAAMAPTWDEKSASKDCAHSTHTHSRRRIERINLSGISSWRSWRSARQLLAKVSRRITRMEGAGWGKRPEWEYLRKPQLWNNSFLILL
jgi:hypothetical protein